MFGDGSDSTRLLHNPPGQKRIDEKARRCDGDDNSRRSVRSEQGGTGKATQERLRCPEYSASDIAPPATGFCFGTKFFVGVHAKVVVGRRWIHSDYVCGSIISEQ